MKLLGLIAFLVSFAVARSLSPDPFLGVPFFVHAFDAGENAQYRAVLVQYAAETVVDSASSPVVERNSGVCSHKAAAVLYIHGFNDYFFQRELAQKMDSAGYSFYAIDLHNYGRSFRDGETMGALRDISEYYAELDSAIAFIKKDIGDSVPLVLMGHSTGGLIACLYAADRDNGSGIAAIILNSPFFEMNYVWPVRSIAVPVLSALGSVFPDVGVPRGKNENYDKSLLKTDFGEWEYDSRLKVRGSLSIDLGWLRAIHRGHARIQQGLSLVSPILVMHSGCSYREDDWSEEYTRCDGVLNVEHIRKFGANLGPSVQLEKIEGGLHDLVLSRGPVREEVYRKMFLFMDSRLRR